RSPGRSRARGSRSVSGDRRLFAPRDRRRHADGAERRRAAPPARNRRRDGLRSVPGPGLRGGLAGHRRRREALASEGRRLRAPEPRYPGVRGKHLQIPGTDPEPRRGGAGDRDDPRRRISDSQPGSDLRRGRAVSGRLDGDRARSPGAPAGGDLSLSFIYPPPDRPVPPPSLLGRSAARRLPRRPRSAPRRRLSTDLDADVQPGSDENPDAGPLYCCQQDGMVGLGCGARSYTRTLHYSTEWAVGRSGVREILDDYIQRGHRDDHRFAAADYGFILGPDEQRRRFVLLSLLQNTGLDLTGYRLRFGGEAMDDLPALADLAELGLARRETERLVLTAAGLERSDAIGPWLSSRPVAALQESYALR